MFKIINRSFQPIRLVNRIIPSFEKRPKNEILVEEITAQIRNLSKKGVLRIKKL